MFVYRFEVFTNPENGWRTLFEYDASHEHRTVKNSMSFHVITGKHAQYRLAFTNAEVSRDTAVALATMHHLRINRTDVNLGE